ncbi:hypothetical protein Harman_39510 [Haloarcula mannanilytica]|uniref:Uncharacterized protein n=1 Tax=Haloarcula mannanilytica TaxID=2509225 RepID=A0A4C2ENU2_9EURY|nr:hypothetical protein Harman_39510 [Haloarcula mannanilytica]
MVRTIPLLPEVILIITVTLWFYRNILGLESSESQAMEVVEAFSPTTENRLADLAPPSVYSTTPVEAVPFTLPHEESPDSG